MRGKVALYPANCKQSVLASEKRIRIFVPFFLVVFLSRFASSFSLFKPFSPSYQSLLQIEPEFRHRALGPSVAKKTAKRFPVSRAAMLLAPRHGWAGGKAVAFAFRHSDSRPQAVSLCCASRHSGNRKIFEAGPVAIPEKARSAFLPALR